MSDPRTEAQDAAFAALDSALAICRTYRRQYLKARGVACPTLPQSEDAWRKALASVDLATAALIEALGGTGE